MAQAVTEFVSSPSWLLLINFGLGDWRALAKCYDITIPPHLTTKRSINIQVCTELIRRDILPSATRNNDAPEGAAAQPSDAGVTTENTQLNPPADEEATTTVDEEDEEDGEDEEDKKDEEDEEEALQGQMGNLDIKEESPAVSRSKPGVTQSPETPQTLPLKTFDGLLSSPGYAQAEDKALYVLSSLAVTDLEKQQIERATVGQAKNASWSAYHNRRITASNFGLVLAAVTRNSYPPSLFKTLLGQYSYIERSDACCWGILHGPRAKQQYTEHTGVIIQERGLFLSNSGLLGGSPDGTVSDDCIIEVKCPWSARTKTILQAAESRDFFLQSDQVTGSLTLKQTHRYWHQIQGNLHLTNASRCELVVWTPLDFIIVSVLKDPSWAGNIDILETFYRDRFLPRILSEA